MGATLCCILSTIFGYALQSLIKTIQKGEEVLVDYDWQSEAQLKQEPKPIKAARKDDD